MVTVAQVYIDEALTEDAVLLKHLPGAIARAELGPQRPCVALSVDGAPRYALSTNGVGINVSLIPGPEDPEHELFLALPDIDLVEEQEMSDPGIPSESNADDPWSDIPTALAQILKEIQAKTITPSPRSVPEGEPWRPRPKGKPVESHPRVMDANEVEDVLTRHRQALHPIDGPHLLALLRSTLAYGDENAAQRAASMIAPGATFRVVDDHGWISVEAMEGWKVTTFQLGGGTIPQAHALLVGAISLRQKRLNAQHRSD